MTFSGFISRLGLLFALPLWALKISTLYNEIVRNQEIMFTLCNIKVQEAIAKHEKDGSLEGTEIILENKLTRQKQFYSWYSSVSRNL